MFILHVFIFVSYPFIDIFSYAKFLMYSYIDNCAI